jgi:hypothetical protein
MKMESNDVNTFRGDSTSLRLKVFFDVFLFCAYFWKQNLNTVRPPLPER